MTDRTDMAAEHVETGDRRTGAIAARGREIVAVERSALQRLEGLIGEAFEEAVALLEGCAGKIVLTGVGKSGIIAQKITATLNSTGTPALYLHPIDALHGDLGVVQPGDVVIIFSKSGNTAELAQLFPPLRALGVRIIAVTGNPSGPLSRIAAVTLDSSVEREACPFDLAPTASTTAMLALGDALAVVLYERKGFTAEDFAATHPGGNIGRRLLLRLQDLMKTDEAVPTVEPGAEFGSVILEMSRKRLGAALVVDGDARLAGIITDGDLRRLLERRSDIYSLTAHEMMTADPMTAPPDTLGSAALMMLEEKKRTHLPVTGSDGKVLGIVHMHDLIEAGLKS